MCVRNKGFKLSEIYVSLKIHETDATVARDLVFYAARRMRDAPVTKSPNYMTAVYPMLGVVVRKVGNLEKQSACISQNTQKRNLNIMAGTWEHSHG